LRLPVVLEEQRDIGTGLSLLITLKRSQRSAARPATKFRSPLWMCALACVFRWSKIRMVIGLSF